MIKDIGQKIQKIEEMKEDQDQGIEEKVNS